MRSPTIITLGMALFSVACSAQQPPLLGPQSPKYQGIGEKQPINHPARGVEATAVPGQLVPSRPQVLIPELTEIRLTLRDDMKSGFTRPGSEVLFQVAADVYGPGPTLVLTKGTPAVGHVIMSDGHQSFGRSGHLFLTCDYILAQDKTRIPLRAVEKQAYGKSANDKALVAALGGVAAGIGSLAAALGVVDTSIGLSSSDDHAVKSWWPIEFLGPVVAAFIEGKNVNLHPGQEFVVHTEQDVATIAPLPYAMPVTTDIEDPDQRMGHLAQKYQSLKHYPTVSLKSGDTIFGVVKKDADGKWATVYGPLQTMSRVLVDDIVTIQ